MPYQIGEEFAAEWNRIRDKVDGTTGPETQNNTHSITHTPRQPGDDGKGWPLTVRIKITGAIQISSVNTLGRYVGKIFTGFCNNNPSNLSEADLGNLSSNVIEVWNLSEINLVGAFPLLVGQIVQGTLGGFNATTSKPIYHCASGSFRGFWAKLDSNTTVSPYQYGWSEQATTASGWTTKAGGRSGTTTTNFATNALDAGFYGEEMVETSPGGVYVWMIETQDSAGNLNYHFEFAPVLRVGYANTSGTTSLYGLATPPSPQKNISHLEFWPDDFLRVVSTDTTNVMRATESDWLWKGFDVKAYDGSPVSGGPFKVMEFKQPVSAGTGTGYDIYWTLSSNSSPRTTPAVSPLNVGNAEVAGKVFVPPLKVSGCSVAAADTTTIAFGQGLSVSNAGGTASVALSLTAGTNIKIEDYFCTKKISVDPIATITYVTGGTATAVCNGDQTITVTLSLTTATAKVLA
jgi:hypothetical protein